MAYGFIWYVQLCSLRAPQRQQQSTHGATLGWGLPAAWRAPRCAARRSARRAHVSRVAWVAPWRHAASVRAARRTTPRARAAPRHPPRGAQGSRAAAAATWAIWKSRVGEVDLGAAPQPPIET
eukprot:scaffold58817_cov70-Phaeocystis_antarctica.AAC.3